ncbi:hypothetical protein CCU68_18375 [Pseudomonas gingeri NCPPB 3146 = LMG 5327]|uniref:Uncharacterized protein n=2 Tax=Pseudomonas gingeri TaxID=117681 RepID=A0A7Y7XZG8_9PSED|nr:hypothetical protein [Pseudomonas gingeri]NWC14930.1 hypothetical protein [Pseudomonas gingeri]PNQ91078.1 hypothetical protein CCU68_18375 [Pseudomonas gingeri NCPPB 3146 = LMG 5327]
MSKPTLPPAAGIATQSILNLEALQVPDALPMEADDYGYQIPRDAQLQDLKVVIEKVWDNYEGGEDGDMTYVDIYFDYIPGISPATTVSLRWPFDPALIFPLSASIPQSYLASPGRHELSYIVTLDGNPSPPSEPIVIDIDTSAPNGGAAWTRLQFPVDTIDESYLNDPGNNDQVIAMIEPWDDIKLKDVASGHWEALNDPDTDAVNEVIIEPRHLKEDPDPIELVFTGDDIRDKGEGEFFPYYILNDKVGNVGDKSRRISIVVDLAPAPVTLLPPKVPQADDGLVDLEDARAPGGVLMLVDEIIGSAPGDILNFYWNLQHLDEHEVVEFQSWPIPVPVSWAALITGGTQQARQTVRVHYTWGRGNIGPRPSIPKFVSVDLTVAGPVKPTDPDPINRSLPQVTVKGVTGDNVLTVADRDQDARVVVPLYADPEPGEVLELIWDNLPTPVDIHTVLSGESEGDEIEMFVPWSFISPVGDRQVPIYYWTFNGVNRQRAEATSVRVELAPIAGLKAPVFPDVTSGPGPGANFINCNLKPWLGVSVDIPGDSQKLDENDEVLLHWTAYASPNWQAGTEMPEAGDVFPHRLTAEEAINGYRFTVVFDPYVKEPGLIKPNNGSAMAFYTVHKATGGEGRSAEKRVYVSVLRPNSPPCLGDD